MATRKKKTTTKKRKKEVSVGSQAENYRHDEEAVQRPEVGIQSEFRASRKPRTYRYDSSLDPALSWDENRKRELAEWLLGLIVEAAEKGEQVVFTKEQEWKGGGVRVGSIKVCVNLLKNLSKPFLNWAGKAERHEITVPTVPLFVHERHSTKAILETIKHRKPSGANLDLFADQPMDLSDKLEAYEHTGPWANRMILGDSLQVMNSLLEYEGLGGQVQMIYMDPPYGVKFGSNFQPFVRKRDVKHGADDSMIREPEMVKAYRDTWELGLHSYLTYLRDRLMLAKELLAPSGSVFVQISDENLQHVRELMDEVFDANNFCGTIAFRTTGGQSTSLLSTSTDFLLWYAKEKDRVRSKFHNPTIPKRGGAGDGSGQYTFVGPTDGFEDPRPMTKEEIEGVQPIPDGWRILAHDTLYSQGAPSDPNETIFEWRGKTFQCPPNTHWKPGIKTGGMGRLAAANRLMVVGNTLRYKRYVNDFPVYLIDNIWNDTAISGFGRKKEYVVETSTKVIERCILMTTEPGDLVFDPTCGSGTTAYVAEQWGRRWITCDTSRVPLALARQRLIIATFSYFELKDPNQGPVGGFVYKRRQNKKGEEVGGRVPHITLGSIVRNEEPKMEVLVDRPETVNGVTRVSGPFVVEATIPAPADLEELDSPPLSESSSNGKESRMSDPQTHIERMVEVLRQSKTLQLPGNRKLNFEQVRRVSDTETLHAEARERNGGDTRIGIVFGPEDGAVTSGVVFEAAREAYFLKYDHLYIFGFAIQAKAREMVGNRGKLKIPCTYVSVTPDVVMSDLLKTSRSSEIFSITGLPDINIRKASKTAADGQLLYEVEIQGLDIFNPVDLETESIDAKNLPCWMLDTDYNDLCFYASQVFFPKTSAWDNLRKSLKGSYDDSVWEHLAGTVSEPFALGEHKRVAVKVIDERGNELMVVREVK